MFFVISFCTFIFTEVTLKSKETTSRVSNMFFVISFCTFIFTEVTLKSKETTSWVSNMFFVISFRTFIFTEVTNTPEKPAVLDIYKHYNIVYSLNL